MKWPNHTSLPFHRPNATSYYGDFIEEYRVFHRKKANQRVITDTIEWLASVPLVITRLCIISADFKGIKMAILNHLFFKLNFNATLSGSSEDTRLKLFKIQKQAKSTRHCDFTSVILLLFVQRTIPEC